jgi:aminoglycoside phosphotransferase family enzyme
MSKNTYPDLTHKVDFTETHISLVFLTDDYVYKVKKSVNFDFLDFSTLEKRKYFCEKEVELNRRLSPDVYLGVLPVTVDDDKIVVGGKGRTIEYAVKMRRIPMETLMIRKLKENQLSSEMVERVARAIAIFHAKAAASRLIDQFGSIEVIKANTDENFSQTEKYVGMTITKSQFDSIKSYTDEYFIKRADLFSRRVSEGKIRDCHGDLHLEHICLTDPIRIFDCIEFNDRFRYSDTAADVAFLAMDLDFNSRRDLSDSLIEAYVRFSGDEGLRGIVNFYKVYRAYVRGKVTSFRLDQRGMDSEQVHKTAQKYFELAQTLVREELLASSSQD